MDTTSTDPPQGRKPATSGDPAVKPPSGRVSPKGFSREQYRLLLQIVLEGYEAKRKMEEARRKKKRTVPTKRRFSIVEFARESGKNILRSFIEGLIKRKLEVLLIAGLAALRYLAF